MIFITIFSSSTDDKKYRSLLNKNEVVNREHKWQMIIERVRKRDDKNGEQIYRQQLINGVNESKNCCMRNE